MRLRFALVALFIGLLSLVRPLGVPALDGEAIRQLKAAGVADVTIAVLVEHRSIETGQLTVAEVAALKEAGLSEGTLQQIIARGSFVAGRSERVYGAGGHGIGHLTVEDILRLKAAGISEETLQALVAGAEPDGRNAEIRRAWRMLENWGVVIDRRD